MSKHAATVAQDPAAAVSPKVKSAGIWVTVFVVVGGAAASAIASIPDSAWEDLGVWAGPVGVFVGSIGAGLAAVVAAYRKLDWLRERGAEAVREEAVPADLPDPYSIPDDSAPTQALLTQVQARRGEGS